MSILNTATLSYIIHKRDDGTVAWTVFFGEGEDVFDQSVVATAADAVQAVLRVMERIVLEG